MQTATPIATDKVLSIQNYNPSALEAFVDTNIPIHKGSTIFVVGHSNTTASLLNILTGGNTYLDIPHLEYDNIYIVTVYQKGNAKVIHMKY